MKITVPRDELAAATQLVARAVSSRASVQILAGILLDAAENRLELAATDMEMSLRSSLSAEVEQPGMTVVPGRLLSEIVRFLPAGDVSLEYRSEDGLVHVSSGTVQYQLHTYAVDDFPRLPVPAEGGLTLIDREAFLETIGKVARAASRDESRPVLTGILVRLEEQKLTMAATDSYRLSVKETLLPSSAGKVLDAIVPARALAEVARIAHGSAADMLELGVEENQVLFRVDGVTVTARRIDGQFPNYSQLRPETFEVELSLPREELLDAVRRVGVMAQRNSPLRLRFEEGQLTVQAQTQDVGEARETLPATYAGEPLEIGFNPEFLRDGLESVSEDTVRLKLISSLRPGLITGAGEDFWYLIMPIRLAG